jgi:hypothetical protein
MIRVQFDLRPYAKELEKVAKRAFPHATRNALNAMAFEGRKLWQQEMRGTFTLRNKWTEMGVRVFKAKGVSIPRMKATVMHPDGYLYKQEYGGIEPRSAVPTPTAAGQGRAGKRTKLVRRPFKVGAISLGDRLKAGSRAQRNVAAVHMAAKAGRRFVYLEGAKKHGIFLIKGGKRRPRVEMLHDTTSGSHRVPPPPTLQPAINKLNGIAPKLMKEAVVEQLRRAKAFGY